MARLRTAVVVATFVTALQSFAFAQTATGKIVPPPQLGLLLVTDKISTAPVHGNDWSCTATNVSDADAVHMVINVYVDILFKPGPTPTKSVDCNDFAIDPAGTLPHQTCSAQTSLAGTGFLFSTAHCEVKVLSGSAANVRASILGTSCDRVEFANCVAQQSSDAR